MSRRFDRGLVVGKFSPLHRGHELLISSALASCEELFVLSYATPERPGCEAAVRERWLAELFPTARSLVLDNERLRRFTVSERWPHLPDDDAPEEDHRRFCAEICLEILGGPVSAVFTSEQYGDGFAAVLTECFRARTTHGRAVTHVLVDLERRQVPISASAISADVHGAKQWLSPVVYASFVERICLLGGESTGKSTLAVALAERLNTIHVPEYGRTLWEQKNGNLVFDDLLAIGQRQVTLEEEAALHAHRYLVCDTSPLTTLFYSLAMFNRADPTLVTLAERRYHHVLVCAPDFAFVQDGTRQDKAFRDRQQAWYAEQLISRGVAFTTIRGTLEERLAQVETLLRLPC